MHESLFYRTSEFVIRWLFFASLLAATEIGFRLGRRFGDRIPDGIKSEISTVETGILSVLALLLGFTTSMAVSRFELLSNWCWKSPTPSVHRFFARSLSPPRQVLRSPLF